jgi:hypothetical protein
MNHHWKNNTCTRCGIKREKRRSSKVLYLYPVLTPAGEMVDKAATKVVSMYHYGKGYGFDRPDCPDVLAAA